MPGRRRRTTPREPAAAASFVAGALGAKPPSPGVRDQVAELGGTRAVAERTGRSERTIRRWAHNDRVPVRGGAADTFGQAVQQHRNTAAYRQSQVNHRRDTRMRNHGATISFTGIAGPLTDSPGASIKRRNIQWHLTGDVSRTAVGARTGTAALRDRTKAHSQPEVKVPRRMARRSIIRNQASNSMRAWFHRPDRITVDQTIPVSITQTRRLNTHTKFSRTES